MRYNNTRFISKWLLVFSLLSVPFFGMAQTTNQAAAVGDVTIVDPTQSIKIPFEIYEGNLLLKPQINGATCQMYVDNGVLWDQLIFFGTGLVDSLNSNYTAGGETMMASDKQDLKDAKSVLVDFGNVKFSGQPTIVERSGSITKSSLNTIEGKISALFFKQFIVEVDYEKNLITLLDPQTFIAPQGYEAVKMTTIANGVFTIPSILTVAGNPDIAMPLIIDMGASSGFTYFYEADLKFNNDAPQPKLASYGVLDELKGYDEKALCLQIGKYKMKNVTGDFIERNAQNKDIPSSIGIDVLKRFNAIFDYLHGVVYLKANSNY